MKQKKEKRQWKIQTLFTICFFAIVFPFFLILMGILLILARNGLDLTQLLSPSVVVFIISMLCIFLGYTTSYIFMRIIFSPLEKASKATKEIASGNYDIQLDVSSPINAIDETIQNFNFMASELNSVEIMRKDFIANVSHEFKTPLSSITGYVTLLQDPDLTDEERTEYIKLAFFNIEKLNDLTGNILQLSSLENQRNLEAPVSYRLDEQLREAIVLLEPKWSAKNISLELDLPPVIYNGQKALLLQVWINLISNAIKFSDEKGTVSVTLSKNQGNLEVTVSDNGIGMDKKTVAHIFEKFYQGDSSRRSQGNGLGLPLCKKIIDLCGGKISVESKPNQGSTFKVVF